LFTTSLIVLFFQRQIQTPNNSAAPAVTTAAPQGGPRDVGARSSLITRAEMRTAPSQASDALAMLVLHQYKIKIFFIFSSSSFHVDVVYCS
jgi:hypothetical protein